MNRLGFSTFPLAFLLGVAASVGCAEPEEYGDGSSMSTQALDADDNDEFEADQIVGGNGGASEKITVAANLTIDQGKYYKKSFTKTSGWRYTVCINVSQGDANLYGDYRTYPTTDINQYKSINTGLKDDCIAFPSTSSGTYYISIYGNASGTSKFTYRLTETDNTWYPTELKGMLTWPVACSGYTSDVYGPYNAPWGNSKNAPFFSGYQNYMHNGADIPCNNGSAVYAACKGPIIKTNGLGSESLNGTPIDWGYYVLQECTINNKTITIAYDHLAQKNLMTTGSPEPGGTPIGYIADLVTAQTDNSGEVNHLHLGMCNGASSSCLNMTGNKDCKGPANCTIQAGAMPDIVFQSLTFNPTTSAMFK